MHPEIPSLIEKYYQSRPNWVDPGTRLNQMIECRLTPHSVVLEVGAGSGAGYVFGFRGRVARYVGLDVSPKILQNPHLDQTFCSDAAQMPFSDEEFDLAFSSYVFEHLVDPHAVIQETYRVLKSGGHFLVLTPNKWHYVPLIARLLPGRLHDPVLRRYTVMKPQEVCPKVYALNTAATLKHAFEKVGFTTEQLLLVEDQPNYLMFSPMFFRMGVLYERLVNATEVLRNLRVNIYGVFRK